MEILKVYYSNELLFTLNFEMELLTHNGTTVHLTHTEFNCLICLLSNREALTSRRDLERHIWPQTNSNNSQVNRDTNLTQVVCTLRQKLKCYSKKRDIILTVPKKGYRLNSRITTKIAQQEKDKDYDRKNEQKNKYRLQVSTKTCKLTFTSLLGLILIFVFIKTLTSL